MTVDTHASCDQEMVEEAAERASIAEEANCSDRSSQGSIIRGGGHIGGSGYSADCSGSASEEDEDEGPLSGSGSDDNNSSNNRRQASSIAIGSEGGLSALAPALPDSVKPSIHEAAHQDDEIPSKKASSIHSTSSNGKDISQENNVQQKRIESLISSTDLAQVSHPLPSCTTTAGTKTLLCAHPPNHVRSSQVHKPVFTSHHRTKNNNDSTDSSSTSESSSSGSCFTGPLVRRPMDPRIDLSLVQTAQSLQEATRTLQDQNQSNLIMNQPLTTTSTQDCYHLLMDAVRPFFQDPGGPQHLSVMMQQELHRSASEAFSEGFTSFFSTTDSTTEANNNDSQFERRKHDDNENESMAVLARTGRKRKLARRDAVETSTETSGGDSTGALAENHVPIQGTQQHKPVIGVDAAEQPQQPIMHQSSRNVVTDVSGSSSGRNNSSSAGSGDGGNSKMGTTSSSGNDAGGKSGSSEELGAKGEELDGTNDNSESTSGSNDGKPKASLFSNHTSTDPASAAAICGPHYLPFGATSNNCHPHQQPVARPHQGAERERKLHDKKRRRIEMRREYEAQQQFDSSETSDVQEQYFKPGRTVSMANVLGFSKIPRIVVQAKPPFLVVHTNAAYCRLTGIDSHMVVGKPIRELLSIDRSSRGLQLNAEETQDSDNEGVTENARNESSMPSFRDATLEQLIVKNGFGRIFTVQAHKKLLHQMVGRKVTVFSNNDNGWGAFTDSIQGRVGEVSNNGTSLASTCSGINRDREPFPCRISIAPIVSAVAAASFAVDREAEAVFQKSKRTKHSHDPNTEQHEAHDSTQSENKCVTKSASVPSHRKGNQTLQMVTHYVIQLHPHGMESYEGSMESLSSNSASVEARLLGLSKEQLQQQRDVANVEQGELLEMDESVSEATAGTKEPVAAIG